MKILIVQLSDMHCKSQDGEYSLKIRKAAVALKTLGPVQSAVVIFSGDLTNSASKNEFKAGKKILKGFLSELQTEIGCKRIPLLIVPGNHDMFLPDGCRDFDEILTWNKDEHLDEELDRLSKFFEYAHSQGCFTDGSNLYHVKTIEINGVKIQACLLNSAPYSTRKPNDKQIHYFPPYVIEKISRDPSAHLKFSIMHHS